MKSKKERLDILEELEKGNLSPEKAAELLQEDPESLLNELDNPMDVLEALEGGKISPDQAAVKLRAGKQAGPGIEEQISYSDAANKSRGPKNDSIWMMSSALGITIIALSAWWMSSRLTGPGGMDIGFFITWFPFLIGLLISVLAWMSLNSPIIKIRVRSKNDGNLFQLNIGFPFPKRILKWGIRKSGRFGQNVNMDELDTLLNDLEKGNLADPIIIHVNDDDDDVEIVIG